ncbi:MAG: EF-hand domain-containing protein, partial [Thermoguttaceae bacterium]
AMLWVSSLWTATSGIGCSPTVPPPPKWPTLTAADVADRALQEFDANHDGKLDATELKQAPGLRAALATMDSNHDGVLTREEIVARVGKWLESPQSVAARRVSVFLDDQPLDGATVTFEPEKCMGPDYQPCTGVSKGGRCLPQGSNSDHAGLYVGLYRVRVSKQVDGKETIPARYNTQTELGLEAAPDVPAAIHLTSQ